MREGRQQAPTLLQGMRSKWPPLTLGQFGAAKLSSALSPLKCSQRGEGEKS
jgi:hypothetical protein